jgi:catechol 2,3-dioxygenase-like lactoylglutathione lyase family enzyme
VIQHVALEVREADVEAEVAFWAALGWTQVEPPGTLRERAVWVARGEQAIHLFLVEDPVAPPSGHVALDLGDALPAAVGLLRGQGLELDERPRHWGAERWFARSPAGHRVELMAAPPG